MVRGTFAALAALMISMAAGATAAQVPGNLPPCAAGVTEAFRSSDVKLARKLARQCKKQLAGAELASATAAWKRMDKAAGVAARTRDRSDNTSRIDYANALIDLGEFEEGEQLLEQLLADGVQQSGVAAPLSVRLVARGDYANAVDAVAALPEEQFDRNAALALAGAAGVLLLDEILKRQGEGGAAVSRVLDSRGSWFNMVLAQAGSQAPEVAGYLKIVFDAAGAGAGAEGEDGWLMAGRALRAGLVKHRKKLGTDNTWGKLAVLSILFDNRSEDACQVLTDGVKALDSDDPLYPVALSLGVAVEVFKNGKVAGKTRKQVVKSRDPAPLSVLAAARYLEGVQRDDSAAMGEGSRALREAVDKLTPSRFKVAAINNLSIALARAGKGEEALKLLEEAHDLADDPDDRFLLQVNALAITAQANGVLSKGNADFLMSIASANEPSHLVRLVATRLLLKFKSSVAGLKAGSLQELEKECLAGLTERGLCDLKLQAAVQGGLDFALGPENVGGGKVDVDFIVDADVILFLWYEAD